MADVRTHAHQVQVHPLRQHEGGIKVVYPQSGPSSTQVPFLIYTILGISAYIIQQIWISFVYALHVHAGSSSGRRRTGWRDAANSGRFNLSRFGYRTNTGIPAVPHLQSGYRTSGLCDRLSYDRIHGVRGNRAHGTIVDVVGTEPHPKSKGTYTGWAGWSKAAFGWHGRVRGAEDKRCRTDHRRQSSRCTREQDLWCSR